MQFFKLWFKGFKIQLRIGAVQLISLLPIIILAVIQRKVLNLEGIYLYVTLLGISILIHPPLVQYFSEWDQKINIGQNRDYRSMWLNGFITLLKILFVSILSTLPWLILDILFPILNDVNNDYHIAYMLTCLAIQPITFLYVSRWIKLTKFDY